LEINITLLFELFIFIGTFLLLSKTLFKSVKNVLDNRKINHIFQKNKIESLHNDINIHKKYVSEKINLLLFRTNKQFHSICRNTESKMSLRYKHLQKKVSNGNSKIFDDIENKSLFIRYCLKSKLSTFFLQIYNHLY